MRGHLGPDDVLAITITDIDLAGETYFTSRGLQPRVRVLRGREQGPRIALRTTWTTGGRTVGPIDEVVEDPDYFLYGPQRTSHEPLPYEQRMLERWFRDRFAKPARRPD